MAFSVYDNNKPASEEGSPILKGFGWTRHAYPTFLEAKSYGIHWLGSDSWEGVLRKPDVVYEYGGAGDTIEIREEK